MYSHNMYIGNDNTDITLRDSISMRASSFGAQVRPGGFIEDNVFIDNNAAFATVGGDYKDAGYVGYYSLLSGNIVTSGAHKDADMIGAFTLGLTDDAMMTSLVDNVVAHLSNPDDPSELDYKYWINDANRSIDPYYNDTIVWNWMGSRAFDYPDKDVDVNVEGLDPSVMDATTIQRFAAQLLGTNTATIGDLADYLRAQADGTLEDVVDADLIIKFFQEGFGIDADMRDGAETLRFIPNDLGDGVRWDNHLNWSTDDLPGLYAEDDVDLGGNHVVFGTNATIDELEFGPDGELEVYGGKLTVAGGVTGDYAGSLDITSAGQFWTEGGDADNLDIDVMGGRFVNTGAMSGADLSVTGGQAILASDNAEYDVESGDKLSVSGGGRAGFDGEDGGLAILDMHEGATLEFLAGDGDLGSISEFRSGAFGDSDVKSGIDLGDFEPVDQPRRPLGQRRQRLHADGSRRDHRSLRRGVGLGPGIARRDDRGRLRDRHGDAEAGLRVGQGRGPDGRRSGRGQLGPRGFSGTRSSRVRAWSARRPRPCCRTTKRTIFSTPPDDIPHRARVRVLDARHRYANAPGQSRGVSSCEGYVRTL